MRPSVPPLKQNVCVLPGKQHSSHAQPADPHTSHSPPTHRHTLQVEEENEALSSALDAERLRAAAQAAQLTRVGSGRAAAAPAPPYRLSGTGGEAAVTSSPAAGAAAAATVPAAADAGSRVSEEGRRRSGDESESEARPFRVMELEAVAARLELELRGVQER